MNYNEKIISLFDALKCQGRIKTYVQLAEILETNKAGINDIKQNKKKVTLENLASMKKSYPDINLDWFISGYGNMFVEHDKETSMAPDAKYMYDKLFEEYNKVRNENTELLYELSSLKKAKPYEIVDEPSIAAEPELKYGKNE